MRTQRYIAIVAFLLIHTLSIAALIVFMTATPFTIFSLVSDAGLILMA